MENLSINFQVARPFIFSKLGTVPPVEKEDKLFELFEKFLSFSLPKTYTAKTLATELPENPLLKRWVPETENISWCFSSGRGGHRIRSWIL